MALRNQPYLPLYIQDFMTDEKLAECSAQATGVYIRIMCLMHKSETYGKVLLKQKHKQTDKQIKNFALMVARNLPYTSDVVLLGLEELLLEGVLQIEGDYLVQKRMVKDNDISEKRSVSGKLGGEKTKLKTNKFAQAKVQANTEYEIEYENEIENEFKTDSFGKSKNLLNNNSIISVVCRNWYNKFPTYTKDQDQDYKAVNNIIEFMARQHSIIDINSNTDRALIITTMEQIAAEVEKDPFWANKPLKSIANNIQEFYNKIKNPKNVKNNGFTREGLQAAFDARFADQK